MKAPTFMPANVTPLVLSELSICILAQRLRNSTFAISQSAEHPMRRETPRIYEILVDDLFEPIVHVVIYFFVRTQLLPREILQIDIV